MNTINMTEIARQAGVSQKTVSRVLNNEKYVRQDVRDRVQALVKKLNYQPNHFAASLKKGKTNLIGISISGRNKLFFTEPYLNQIYTGVGKVLTGAGYKMIFHLLNAEKEDIDQAQELVESRTIDGMVYILGADFYQEFQQRIMPYFLRLGTPFVVIHSLNTPLDCPNIGLDSFKAGYLAARHLIERGYESIGCIRRPDRYLHTMDMYQGYKKALQEIGKRVDSGFEFIIDNPNKQGAYEEAVELIRNKESLPRALFVTGDSIAAAVIRRFKEEGIRVPDDVAVVGFGDAEDPFHLLLTTIRQPAFEKGMMAAEYLIKRIEHPEEADGKWFHCFEPKLVVRDTCGVK